MDHVTWSFIDWNCRTAIRSIVLYSNKFRARLVLAQNWNLGPYGIRATKILKYRTGTTRTNLGPTRTGDTGPVSFEITCLLLVARLWVRNDLKFSFEFFNSEWWRAKVFFRCRYLDLKHFFGMKIILFRFLNFSFRDFSYFQITF